MVLDITLTKHQPSEPDFLLPDCSDTAVNLAYIPMSYAKALSSFVLGFTPHGGVARVLFMHWN